MQNQILGKIERICVFFNNNRADVKEKCSSFIDNSINGLALQLSEINFEKILMTLLVFFIFYFLFYKFLNVKKK